MDERPAMIVWNRIAGEVKLYIDGKRVGVGYDWSLDQAPPPSPEPRYRAKRRVGSKARNRLAAKRARRARRVERQAAR